MTVELTALALTLVLAIVYVLVPTHFRNQETGIEWNIGPRDQPGPPMGVLTGRLTRARDNLFETLPIYIGAVVLTELIGQRTLLTAIGAWLYPLGRIAYLPLYAYGVVGLRTAAWMIGLMGIVALLVSLFLPG